MKVQFPNNGMDLSNDSIYSVAGHERAAGTQAVTGGFSLDISGGDKDISAYGMEELKSFADVKSKASVKDVSLEHNALAVMSNCMSGEDFAGLTEEGFSPEDMSVTETVTSLDRIKATLAMSGVVIPGYTDDLSIDQIEEITGSAAYASEIETALKAAQVPVTENNVRSVDDIIKLSETVTGLTDNAVNYMINNDMELTVSDMYMASHSTGNNAVNGRAMYYRDASGYVGKNAGDADIAELTSQIETIITEADLPVNDETAALAKYLIQNGQPLTQESLKKLSDIRAIGFPLSIEDIAASSAAAISDGREAKEAVITNTESLIKKTGRVINDTLRALDYIEKNSADDISKHRLIEEIRLQLTAEAALHLQKKGIKIDTADLSKLVDDLKQAEKEALAPFVMDDDYSTLSDNDKVKYDDVLTFRADLFIKTTYAVESIKTAPADLIGDIIGNRNNNAVGDAGQAEPADTPLRTAQPSHNSLGNIADKAASLKASYDKAENAYETMMTKPRADMGDNIVKAFRNVDDILEDLEYEVNSLNEKAVRILGRSGMEINDENIDRALKAEIAIENIISHMTPARTLKMIRDGENPLDEDIYELADRLVKEDATDNEKYSEFLLRLEKSGDITEAEKSSFIGIYRLFKKIEKSDGRLIGDVLKADDRLTFENILTASRSDRRLNTDIKIDDNFGAVEKLITHGKSITDQILEAFRSADESHEYERVKAAEIQEAIKSDADVMKLLDNVNEPLSPINMTAAEMLMSQRGSVFRGLKALADNAEADFDEEIDKLRENLTDDESARSAYDLFDKKAAELIKNASDNADKYIDVRSLKLMGRQVGLIRKAANEKAYEVPVMINGELTGINLKIINDSDNAGKISISYKSDETGAVSAELNVRDGVADGFIKTDEAYFDKGHGHAAALMEALTEELFEAGIDVSNMYAAGAKSVELNGNYTQKNNNSTPGTRMLYTVAKAVITAVERSSAK